MIKLADAISSRFPQGNEWAALALERLAGGIGPADLVHDVAEGWMRRGAGEGAELIDTLFVLTDDRLGLGQAVPAAGTPGWIDLASIAAVDAVDRSPLPLQTIEMEFADGTTMCVGWPEAFSGGLVPVLEALVTARADHALPAEFADGAATAHDPSLLDEISPSEWVEQPVVPAIDFLHRAEPEVASPPTAPFDAAALAAPPFAVGLPEEPGPTTTSGADAWFSVDPSSIGEPLDPLAFAPDTAPVDTAPVNPAPPRVSSSRPPWEEPGVTWPDPLRGVLYLGGHPGYPRKRKNGTMIFSAAGLDVRGTGFQDWDMSMDWAYLDGIDIQGPDEIMFGDHLKIDSTSSALVISMSDGTRMFFEIRTRRPPSLRSTLAPLLMMVQSIRGHRAEGAHH
jgi:hypothetical protein